MDMNDLLSLLDGSWSGVGTGEYPTIEPFEYQESLRFTLDKTRPVIHYEQKTRRRNSEHAEYSPSHWETGFIELLPEDKVEIANAQSGGRVEALAGTIEATPTGFLMRLQSVHLGNDPRMRESKRRFVVSGDSLYYTMHMRTVQVPHMALHLEATLHRR